MKEDQLRVLKVMNEATNRMDLNAFAQAVSLSPNQAIDAIHKLAEEGFLKKVGSGYCLTEKGKNSLKITENIGEDKRFQFYIDVDKSLGFGAQTLEEFYMSLRNVSSDSLEFHLYRGDFEKWISDVLLDTELAKAIADLKNAELHEEELRKALLKVIDDKYGIIDLI